MAGSPSTEPAPRAASARRASLSRLRGIERSVRFSLGDPERTMPALDRPRRANNNENSKFSPDPPRTVKKATKKKAVPKQAMARKPRVSTNAAHVQQRSARPESAHPSDHSDHPLWYLADLAAEIPGGVGSPQTRDGGKPRTREIADECDHHERVQLTREAIALEVSRLDDLRRARLGLKELRARAVPRIRRGGPRGGAPRVCHAPGGGVACVRGTQRGEVERPAEKGRRVAGGGQTEAARDRGEGGEAGGTGQFSREGEGRRRAGLARHPRHRHARDDSVVRDRRGTQGCTRVAHPALERVRDVVGVRRTTRYCERRR